MSIDMDMVATEEEAGILNPTVIAFNSKKQRVFALKPITGFGKPYFVFEKHEELCDESEKQGVLFAYQNILRAAARLSYSLYDIDDVNRGMQAAVIRVLSTDKGRQKQEEANKLGRLVFVEDVTITIMNYVTGKVENITIGINAPPMKNLDKYRSHITGDSPSPT